MYHYTYLKRLNKLLTLMVPDMNISIIKWCQHPLFSWV